MKNIGIPVKFGAMIAIGLIIYFLALSLVGLHTNPLFSFVNCLIVGFGLWSAIKAKRNDDSGLFKYGEGFTTALITGFIGTTLFTIFFGIYASELNPDFLDEFLTMWRSQYQVGLGAILFTVYAMGAATTFALTLTFMQLFKKSWNTTEGQKHTL
ncbi:DUF4199 domain-containing protein [Zunongwangia atlantica]|uniref:DUF4199 domain-containing protein n=1 Tax=Zunongwangia atlantica 22II14-10F7 TaxID=1185767 RepID=A0A1Y1T4V9_9FLAO|nr:DUF4199 domain-containing protein [Zunongwangia atlantica]ORL46078.1 hypothetical protein IIF7_08156 [Zunongwangia atlantica 22II14-10F7]